MFVTRRAAFAVATLAILIPAMSYGTSIVPEVLAYPWYALCSWLIVRALATNRRLDLAWAVAATIVAVLVRWPRFAIVVFSFALAYVFLWLTGPRSRAIRANWTRSDYAGAIALFAGFFIVVNRVVLQHFYNWQITSQYEKGRMVDLSLKAALALTVGMAILPVVGGLMSVWIPERRGQPAYRAFVAYLVASITCITLYTAVKAAFLSTVFGTLTEERNMFYISPTLLVGTALVMQSRRLDWRVVAIAAAFVFWLIYAKPVNLLYPYFEAPGFAILDVFTEHFQWTRQDLRLALLLTLAVSLVALRFRHVKGVASVLVVVGAAWMLTSEIGTTVGSNRAATQFIHNLPPHLDWVDRRVHGAPVTYLGQGILDPNGIILTEFWNRSIKHIDSLDGSAPGPGFTYTPNVVGSDGRLTGMQDIPYVLADQGVRLQAPVVPNGRWKQLTIYRRRGPWRLLDTVQQVYTDSWAPHWSTYTYFKPNERGTLFVHIGRQGYNGDAPAGHAVISAGTVVINGNQQAQLGHVFERVRTIVRNGSEQVFTIPVRRTPVRVVVTVTPTFRASVSDPRQLGAQVAFSFVPAKSR
jgi:hypothetical protein